MLIVPEICKQCLFLSVFEFTQYIILYHCIKRILKICICLQIKFIEILYNKKYNKSMILCIKTYLIRFWLGGDSNELLNS